MELELHRIWFVLNNKVDSAKAYLELAPLRDSWTTYNPTMHIEEWNATASRLLIKERFPWLYPTYNNFAYEIQRIDTVRYAILFMHGGIYADMDIECLQPFDVQSFCSNGQIGLVETRNAPFRFLQRRRNVSNCLMVATQPRQLFWLYVLRQIIRRTKKATYMTRHSEIMYTTGPQMLSFCYKTFDKRFPGEIVVLPARYYNPKNLNGKKDASTNPYTIHYGRGMWEGGDSKMLIFVYRHLLVVTIIVSLVCIAILLFLRHVNRNRI